MKFFKIFILKSSICFFLFCFFQICVFHQALASNLLEHEKNNIEVYNKVVPSVVMLKVTTIDRFKIFGIKLESRQSGTAAGVIWDNQGHIVTNHHILPPSPNKRKKTKIKVSFWNDPFIYSASYVDGDPTTDIAVFKLNVYPAPLQPITVGSSADLQIGQEVFSIGHPIDFRYHMSKGIISGINNNHNISQDLLYTDAFMAIGSSGGPLVNTSGEMIGMNLGMVGHPDQSDNNLVYTVQMAIPIDDIHYIVDHILENNPPTLSR